MHSTSLQDWKDTAPQSFFTNTISVPFANITSDVDYGDGMKKRGEKDMKMRASMQKSFDRPTFNIHDPVKMREEIGPMQRNRSVR